MSQCNNFCEVWDKCGYEHKGYCECVHQRKFTPMSKPETPDTTQRRRVMAENPLVPFKEYGVSVHQRTHYETIFCDGHLCREATPTEAARFVNEQEEGR